MVLHAEAVGFEGVITTQQTQIVTEGWGWESTETEQGTQIALCHQEL